MKDQNCSISARDVVGRELFASAEEEAQRTIRRWTHEEGERGQCRCCGTWTGSAKASDVMVAACCCGLAPSVEVDDAVRALVCGVGGQLAMTIMSDEVLMCSQRKFGACVGDTRSATGGPDVRIAFESAR